jgi:hypothetical protein
MKTQLPLLPRDAPDTGLTLLDPARLRVERAVALRSRTTQAEEA